MKIIRTDKIGDYKLFGDQALWCYNGLDCLLTCDIFGSLHGQLDTESTGPQYEYQLGAQALALDMTRTGLKIDLEKRNRLIKEYRDKIYTLGGMKKGRDGKWYIVNEDSWLQRMAQAIWGKPLNYNSPIQLNRILYDNLRVPKYYANYSGRKSLSTKREILEKIVDLYPRARFLVRALLKLRDWEKDLSVLEMRLDGDKRVRCSWKIARVETGRWASSKTPFGTGGNLQNIRQGIREIFVPDPGYVMFYADLKTAESIAVGYLSGDEAYIKACEEGDLHTAVARMVWSKDLDWTGNTKEDKALCGGTNYYRHMSYRDLAKRGGHGSNYLGTPRTMGMHLRVEEKIMKRFQAEYFGGELHKKDLYRWGFADLIDKGIEQEGGLVLIPGAFPGIKQWHTDTINELQQVGSLSTPLGFRRNFWGRLTDTATHREAIAFKPQSLVGQILVIGLFRLWKELKDEGLVVLANGHDAVLGQIPVGTEEKFTPLIKKCMEIPVSVGSRIMKIPVGIKYSNKNWSDASDD